MKYILPIDGGGIRGLIPAMILAELERRTGKPAAEMFDLIAGTSTGGILALTLTRRLGNSNQPMYAAKDIVQFYLKEGPKIFSRSVFRAIFSLNGVLDEKFSSKQLQESLRRYMESSALSDSLSKVLVSAYDLDSQQPFFFKSHKAVTDKSQNFQAWQAALATASAPSYFVPATITGGDGKDYHMIDGGVFATNVSMCAYAEARALWPDEDLCVVSLGTGEVPGQYDYKKLGTGELGWVSPLLNIMFQGSSATVNYQMKQLTVNYYRLQTELKNAKGSMDNASAENLAGLQKDAEVLIAENSTMLDEIASRLIHRN